MDSFFSRFKNVVFLVLLLLAQILGLAVQIRRPAGVDAPDSHNVSLMRHWVVAVITPVESLFLNTGHALRGGWSNYLDLRHVRENNADLHREIDGLRLQQAAIAEDAIQGHRLQTLLAFQQHYIASTVAAQVIGTSGTELSRLLYIDKGSADGLKPDQPVITPDGIVGKLRDVFPHTAQVLEINDQTSGAGVVLASTRIRAIVRGTSTGHIQINNLTPDDRVRPGDTVLTSGGDLVYPRGLPVGTIESIAPDPDHQPYTAIRLRPSANLFQLEEVLIITGTRPTLPPEALNDLAQGAAFTAQARSAAQKAAADRAAADAREAAARSAADVVADRLPSLNDPNAPINPNVPAPAPNTAAPGGVVPKPLPTLHTDRYTPGTTPSASALTPGGPHTPSSAATETPAPQHVSRSPLPAAGVDGNATPPEAAPPSTGPRPFSANPAHLPSASPNSGVPAARFHVQPGNPASSPTRPSANTPARPSTATPAHPPSRARPANERIAEPSFHLIPQTPTQTPAPNRSQPRPPSAPTTPVPTQP